MFKRIVLVAAVFLAACGTEKAPQTADVPETPGNPDTGMAGTVAVANAFGSGTTTAKVVVKTAKEFVTVLTQADPNDPEGSIVIACTGTNTSTCPAVQGVDCLNNQCVQRTYRQAPFYIRDYAPAPTSFQIPCDGKLYVAELYGAGTPAANGERFITERHVSSEFTMNADCSITGLSWTTAIAGNVSPLFPNFAFSPIYVGMGAGFDTFTVAPLGVAYPWSAAGWSVSYSPTGLATPVVTPTSTIGGVATFAAPAATTALDFSGTFNLDRGLLVQSGTAIPANWIVEVGPFTRNPISSGPIQVP